MRTKLYKYKFVNVDVLHIDQIVFSKVNTLHNPLEEVILNWKKTSVVQWAKYAAILARARSLPKYIDLLTFFVFINGY